MAERPILFSSAMVRAILAGTKTQTRRLVKGPSPTYVDLDPRHLPNEWGFWHDEHYPNGRVVRCPYGVPGDRLWVRETWCYKDREFHPEGGVWYAATDDVDNPRWRPSIHMARGLHRITLEVTEVRVQRLQEISEEDAKAEGVEPYRPAEGDGGATEGPAWNRIQFSHLWDSINGRKAPWDSNPWVWAITFKAGSRG